MEKNTNQPKSALDSPRFCNRGSFMRLPRYGEISDKKLDFIVIGVPFDTGSSFRTGSRFGPDAIRQISALIKPNNVQLQVNILKKLVGADYGDVSIIPGYTEPSFEKIYQEIKPFFEQKIKPIILGGDHSIALPNLRAASSVYGPLALIHLDSHADINDQVFGEKHNHGTPFRRAYEEGLISPEHTIQVGMRGSLYDPDEHRIAEEELGFKLIAAHKVRAMGIDKVIAEIKKRVGNKKAYLSFDIDFVDPAFAPGTGTPEIGGFTSYETISIIQGLKDLDLIGCEIVEVAPQYDLTEMTAFIAANIGFEFISILALQKESMQQ